MTITVSSTTDRPEGDQLKSDPSATVRPESAPEKPGSTQIRRVVSQRRETDVLALVGGLASASGLTWLLFTQIGPFSGVVGCVVVGYLTFVGIYALLVSMDENTQAVRDRVVAVVIQGLAGLLLTVLLFVIGYVMYNGAKAVVHVNFYTQDMGTTGPKDPLSKGGVLQAITGTLIEISIALVITVPIGLTCAVFLSEFPGKFARLVRTLTEAMTALPSILAGLFVYSAYVLTFHLQRSGFAAALAISVMMLPIMIRAADVVLRLVPGSLTEASLALGASRWRTVWYVTLPSARSGLATAVILGTARGIGETSPVLLTAGFGYNLNRNPTSGPMPSLPLLVFILRSSGEPTLIARAFGAGTVLMVLVLLLFGIARWIGGRGPGVLTKSQQRRRDTQSHDDATRISRQAAERGARERTAASLTPALLTDVPDATAQREPFQTGGTR